MASGTVLDSVALSDSFYWVRNSVLFPVCHISHSP